uniref:Fibronectin type-II domain-containing protein n=1 Tax=Xiphophorus couchianus TaxID=32473 RepID=A0A3B5MQU1_9TELE
EIRWTTYLITTTFFLLFFIHFSELYTIEGNAAGRPCMFPFFYENQWYSSCTLIDSINNQHWCSVETKFEHQTWGFCPTNSEY